MIAWLSLYTLTLDVVLVAWGRQVKESLASPGKHIGSVQTASRNLVLACRIHATTTRIFRMMRGASRVNIGMYLHQADSLPSKDMSLSVCMQQFSQRIFITIGGQQDQCVLIDRCGRVIISVLP